MLEGNYTRHTHATTSAKKRAKRYINIPMNLSPFQLVRTVAGRGGGGDELVDLRSDFRGVLQRKVHKVVGNGQKGSKGLTLKIPKYF